MKIPFTNLSINITRNATETRQKRPFLTGMNLVSGTSRSMAGFKLDFDLLYAAWRMNSDVYDCIDKLQKNVGISGYQLVDPIDEEAKLPTLIKEETESVLGSLQLWTELKNRIVRDLHICGNAYVALVQNVLGTRVIGLQAVDPRTVSLITDERGNVLEYIQQVAGQGMVFFAPEEIIHFKKGSDPNAEAFGFAPTEPIIWEIRTDLSAMMSNYYFFENDAKPSVQYVLTDEMSANPEAVKSAVEHIKKEFGGVRNRNKSGVIAGVKEIKVLSVSHQDMQFLEGRRFTTEKVCAAYGVPKFLLGYTESVNNNNGTELHKEFYKGTIEGIEELIADTLTRELIPRLGFEGKVKFMFKPQTFDEQRELEERGLRELQSGAITLRQYKIKTGQEITPEDEKNPNIDAHVIHNGSSAVLLEDAGIDPQASEEQLQKTLNKLLILTNS